MACQSFQASANRVVILAQPYFIHNELSYIFNISQHPRAIGGQLVFHQVFVEHNKFK
jgi:hypothetical protein